MIRNGEFYHSLAVNPDICRGCARCIRQCPTRALRIRGGKATIRRNWCVDCAECLKACPVGAIYVEQDDFGRILDYECSVALVPAVFLGQFPAADSEEEIYGALYALGFTHICPVEITAGLIRDEMEAEIAASPRKPLISPFCPAIVRLIQTRFPALVGNIMSIRTPVEATSMLYRKMLLDEGHSPEDIGIFYVAPCAAKAAAIKDSVSEESFIDGLINLDSLYNRVCQTLRNREHIGELYRERGEVPEVSQEDMGWSITSGEASCFQGRCFAVDEIHNVIEFLERLETTDEMHNMDFLELRACNQSCTGGSLTPNNRFLTVESIRMRSLSHPRTAPLYERISAANLRYLKENMRSAPFPPMTKLIYRGSIEEVLEKMESAKKIDTMLPGIDCGACGSPTCKSLAQDIVSGEATMTNCIFMQRILERDGKISSESVDRLLEEVWGRERTRGK